MTTALDNESRGRHEIDGAVAADLARGPEREDRLSPAGGIIRAARRPAGWPVPGARPPFPEHPGPLWPREQEDLCWLAGHWRILQRTDGHRFSLDDLVTAEMASRVFELDQRSSSAWSTWPPASPAAPEAAPDAGSCGGPAFLDLGCGVGTVLLFLAWRFPRARLTGIEAQALSAEMAMRSIAWNGAGARCQVVNGDLREPEPLARFAPFDLITGTPPYFGETRGVQSRHVQRGPCRFEHRGGLAEYCRAAAIHLEGAAPFVGCASVLQTPQLECAAEAAGLAIERRRQVVPRAGKPPLLVTFALRRRRFVRSRIEEPMLVVRDQDGRWTEDFLAVRRAMGMPPSPLP